MRIGIVLFGIAQLVLFVAGIWVAVHFIRKYW